MDFSKDPNVRRGIDALVTVVAGFYEIARDKRNFKVLAGGVISVTINQLITTVWQLAFNFGYENGFRDAKSVTKEETRAH